MLFINDMFKGVADRRQYVQGQIMFCMLMILKSGEKLSLLKNFHPDKCHVFKITLKREKSFDFIYWLGILDLEYASVEKDRGGPIRVTPTLSWRKQWESLISSTRSNLPNGQKQNEAKAYFVQNHGEELISALRRGVGCGV